MINFIIVDNVNNQKIYENSINKIMFNRKEIYTIKNFINLNESLKTLIKEQTFPKIYFININNNGLKIAKYIRTKDLTSEIIVITNSKETDNSIHDIIPKIYKIIKPDNNIMKNIEISLINILNINFDNNQIISIGKTSITQIYLKDIVYIYKKQNERKIIINTSSNEFSINMTLTDIFNKLDTRFIRIHKSCIVNKTKVQIYNWNDGYIILNDNKKVKYCSKKYCKNLISN